MTKSGFSDMTVDESIDICNYAPSFHLKLPHYSTKSSKFWIFSLQGALRSQVGQAPSASHYKLRDNTMRWNFLQPPEIGGSLQSNVLIPSQARLSSSCCTLDSNPSDASI